jgi:MerR family transcriptional regulator/heat shock protein HspR
MEPSPTLLTITALAERLGVHPETIRRWEKSGIIPPATRRRGIRVYRQEDIQKIEGIIFQTPEVEMR